MPFVILAVSVIAELILGNFVYFAFVAGKAQTVNYNMPEGQTHVATGDKTQLYFGDLDLELNSVKLRVKAEEKTDIELSDESNDPFEVNVSIYIDDESVTDSYNLAVSQSIPVSVNEREITLYCNSAGKISDLLLSFGECERDVEITGITVNPEYKLGFNITRFSIILIVGLIAYLYKIRTDEKKLVPYKSRHRRSIALSVGLSVAGTLVVAVLNATGENINPVPYPLVGGAEYYDPYIQQFDAFMKGQLHLDIKPDEALMQLENPYDPYARDGIFYLWDRAYFDGKYFSYFGVAPIFLVYYPFYLIKGMLPHAGFVMAVFCIMTAVFFALAVEEYAKLSGKKHFAYLPAFCAVSAYLASFAILIMRGQARFYYIAGMAGMAFSAAFIFFMLKAVGSKNNVKRIVFFALAGISFGLGFHSRVNSVLPLAIIAAVFVVLWAIRRFKEKQIGLCLGEMAALGAPVALALAASMLYNKARFGSFFDFGTAYQLTVADTSYYWVSANGLIPSFFHYFLQGFKFTTEFPFVGFDYLAATDFGRYVYVDSGLGIFAMPFMLMLLLCPVVFRKKSISLNRKILFAAALASIPVTAFLNFCLGGVIFRYTSDISLLAAFLAAVVALETADSALERFGKDGYSVFRKGLFVLGGANAATALGTVFLRSGNLVSANPVVFHYIRDIFVFWN